MDIYLLIKLCYTIIEMSSNYDNYIKRIKIPANNKEVFFLSLILLFSVFARLIPINAITVLVIIIFVILVSLDFYYYLNRAAKLENRDTKVLEFSWGFVKDDTRFMRLPTLISYLKQKELSFYKDYIYFNFHKLIIILFVFGDFLIVFKNLSFFNSGLYIMMSIFTKFVFLGYIFMKQTYEKILVGRKNTEENLLDIFYSQINSLFSFYTVLFIAFFLLSKYIVEIFFGKSYIPYHSSLPFILLANISLAIAVSIYISAKKINEKTTNRILKVYTIFFSILFVFISVNYVDTITYFIIGSSTLLSIFLYNLVIKKPEYIASTYNHLF